MSLIPGRAYLGSTVHYYDQDTMRTLCGIASDNPRYTAHAVTCARCAQEDIRRLSDPSYGARQAA